MNIDRELLLRVFCEFQGTLERRFCLFDLVGAVLNPPALGASVLDTRESVVYALVTFSGLQWPLEEPS